jgi:sugar lactone lactonase YvrE
VDVAASGKIYFSDASVKFGAQEWGSTYEASLLDIMEHGGHGRLLVFDPQAGKATTVLDGLNFPNGVTVSHDHNVRPGERDGWLPHHSRLGRWVE